MLFLVNLLIPASIQRPIIEPVEFPYLVATQNEEEPQNPPSLASLIGGEYIVSTFELSSPTEAVLEAEVAIQEIWVSASFEELPYIDRCDCISFIKEYWPEFQGRELKWPLYLFEYSTDFGLEKIETPEVGAIVITLDNPYYGHSGIVSWIGEKEFELVEKNYFYCKNSRRIFKKDDKNIVGYLR